MRGEEEAVMTGEGLRGRDEHLLVILALAAAAALSPGIVTGSCEG